MSRFSQLLVVLLLAGFLAGSIAPGLLPVSIVSPTSGSMEPTVPQHAVVVVTDTSPAVGDIALYDSPSRTQPVLHRLVDTQPPQSAASSPPSPQFLTQGDANTQPDQASGASPVSTAQIRGTVVTVQSTPIVIPFVGIPLSNPVFIITLWALLVVTTIQTSSSGSTSHRLASTYPVQSIALLVAICIIIAGPVVIGMTATPITTELTTSSTLSPEQSQVAAPGSTTTHPVTIQSPLLAVVSVSATTESTALSVQSVSHRLGSPTATVHLSNTPSPTPTVHRGVVSLYTYPPVLPGPILSELHRLHTLAPAVVSSLVLAFPVVFFAVTIDPNEFTRPRKTRIRTNRKTNTPQTPPSNATDTNTESQKHEH